MKHSKSKNTLRNEWSLSKSQPYTYGLWPHSNKDKEVSGHEDKRVLPGSLLNINGNTPWKTRTGEGQGRVFQAEMVNRKDPETAKERIQHSRS